MEIERPKLSKRRAYVLKTLILQEALESAKIRVPVHLVFWTPTIDGSILEAFYWLPNQHVPYARVYIRAGSLPKELHRDAFLKLQASALPALVRWLSRLIELPDSSPLLHVEPHFDARYEGGRVVVSVHPDFT